MFRNAASQNIPRSLARSQSLRTNFRNRYLSGEKRSFAARSTKPVASATPRLLATTLASAASVGALAYFYNTPQAFLLDAPGRGTIPGSNRTVTGEEVRQHSSGDSLWVVIGFDVWDVSNFIDIHPGGSELIREHAGKDITELFFTLHKESTLKEALSTADKVGVIEKVELKNLPRAVDPAESLYAERRANFPSVYAVVNLDGFEALAKQLFEGGKPWGYIYSWADDGNAFTSNRSSFSLVRFIPRVLVPVEKVNTQQNMVKSSPIFDLPIFICPTGSVRLLAPGGESSVLRAAAKERIPYCLSTSSSEDVSDVLNERDNIRRTSNLNPIVWYQLYIRKDRGDAMRRLRLVAERGVDAIFFTVDTPVLGNREADASTATRTARGGGTGFFDANISWNDVGFIKSYAPGVPVYLKGVGSADDAKKAFEMGCGGVLLSNHGGRQLDYAPPALATLLDIREQYPELIKNKDFEIYVDGGVRRGTDVLKALCLGAKGVGFGRPFFYANATHGEEGISRATDILKEEIERGMRLLGATSIKELKPEMVEILPGLRGEKPPKCE